MSVGLPASSAAGCWLRQTGGGVELGNWKLMNEGVWGNQVHMPMDFDLDVHWNQENGAGESFHAR